jgi:hypothetical protein
VSSFFNTNDTTLEYNASEPPNDWNRWLDQFVHLPGHTGDYTREEAIAAIEKEGTLPERPREPLRLPSVEMYRNLQRSENVGMTAVPLVWLADSVI